MKNVVPIRPDRERQLSPAAADVDAAIVEAVAAFDELVVLAGSRNRLIRDGAIESMQSAYHRMAGLARTGLEVLP